MPAIPRPSCWDHAPASSFDAGGPPLGMFPGTDFEVGRIVLQPGDVMALYSDGITEAGESSQREFGAARLEAVLKQHPGKPLDEIRQHVLEAVRDWSGEEVGRRHDAAFDSGGTQRQWQ